MDKLRFKPVFTNAYSSINDDEFDGFITAFTTEQDKLNCLFWGLAKLAHDVDDSSLTTKHKISIHALAASMHSLISKNLLIGLTANQKITCCENAALEVSIKAESLIAYQDNDLISIILSMYCSSYAYQGDELYLLPNLLILIGLEGFGTIAKDDLLIEECFTEKLGISCFNYIIFLQALYAMSQNYFVLKDKVWLKNSVKKVEMEKVFDLVINDISIPAFDLPNEKISFSDPYKGKSKAESIFARYPLIKMNDGFSFAGHPFMKAFLHRKFLQKCIYLADGDKRDKLRTLIAQRLEILVGEILKKSKCDVDTQYEIEYIKNSNIKSVDWIFIEKENNKIKRVCLIDAKLKTLTEEVTYNYSSKKFLTEISTAYSKAIAQGITFLYNSNKYLNENKIRPDCIDICTRALSSHRIVLIGITPDLPSLFTISDVRKMLIENVISQLPSEVWDWFRVKYKDRWTWHIMELSELQTFFSLENGKHLGKEINKYLSDTNIDNRFIGADQTLPVNFRSYIINKYGRFEKNSYRLKTYIPELLKIYNDFTGKVTDFFELKPEDISSKN